MNCTMRISFRLNTDKFIICPTVIIITLLYSSSLKLGHTLEGNSGDGSLTNIDSTADFSGFCLISIVSNLIL